MLPVYFCNPGSVSLTEVIDTCGSPTSPELSPVVTGPAADDGTVAAGSGALIDCYRLMWDGDVVMLYKVAYTGPDGVRHRGRAVVGGAGSQLPGPSPCMRVAGLSPFVQATSVSAPSCSRIRRLPRLTRA